MLFYQLTTLIAQTKILEIFVKLKPRHFFYAILLSTIANQNIAAERGPVTNLLMPRYVSLKATEANARRGPSLSHRIDWIFKKKRNAFGNIW